MAAFSEFRVATSTGGYDVVVGDGAFARALTPADVVVVDESLVGVLPPLVAERVLPVVADEQTKTLAGCEELILRMREAGVRRADRLVAVGGGVVQDVATFVADVYMRGLAWEYVPTTLMAMADSCLGGKSSINVGGVKNLVGGIYPPQRVLVDPTLLASLPPTAIAAGLSEAVKIAYCRGPEAFHRYLELHAAFATAPSPLIEHVLRAKKWFIEIDEHDRAERRLLNFGHTFGHALESAVGNRISHGLAVSVGVLCATRHPAAADGPEVDALAAHCRALLADGDTSGLARFDVDRFRAAFRSDKKHSATEFHLILPAPGGGVREVARPSDAEELDLVVRTVEDVLEMVSPQ